MADTIYHIPALLAETLNLLKIKPNGTYIDATFGGGGHSRAIMAELSQEGRLFSFDRDYEAAQNIIDDARFTFVLSNFRYIENFMRFYKAGSADGILADLGVSFHHFDSPERGFSFRTDAPLDMRMNRNAARSAADILEASDEQTLKNIFRSYADLRQPGNVAKAIVKARSLAPIDTTFRLAEAVRPALDPRQEKKELAQVFQALRIETNDEMADLRIFLNAATRVLRPGGRLAVLTYHSIEDRMVKNFMKSGNIDGVEQKDFYGNVKSPWKIITRKPVEPSPEEIEANPRARSAKLRVAELKDSLFNF
ncbi:MAG: 16S rRNA (cytosine(1402)-N(4))-methyltransferase RsmH [Muribaculaceae bacterium]|nr:16S rRNA (cytosine(1402)-N(4))-methyltransferase RsmH [Muribaculaceae bacterium]MDE6754662.1 16S rRNA (cytosine(1402)-N(4))-methyltransferase RsmH [Muribaculaceae bacterium]